MEYYAGIDVSLDTVSVCIVDGTGKIVREAKIATEPDALVSWFLGLGLVAERIGMEAGPLSQWLHEGMREKGLAVELLEYPTCTERLQDYAREDRSEGRSWYRTVDAIGLVPTGALQIVSRAGGAGVAYDTQARAEQAHRRGDGVAWILRGFGLKMGPTTPRTFETRVRELVDGHPTLLVVAEALLAARVALVTQLKGVEKRLISLARDDRRARLLMSAPGVGVIVALTYVSAIDDPTRFRSSKPSVHTSD